MDRTPACVMTRTGLVIAVLAALLVLCAPAQAADGRRVIADPGSPIYSLDHEGVSLSGPVAAFQVSQATPNVDHTVWLCDTSTGDAWPLPRVLPLEYQTDPTVLLRGARVLCVWVQYDGAHRELYLWEGTRAGETAAGFPRLLVDPPGGMHAVAPALGVTRVGGADHVVVAWEDDRAPAAPYRPYVRALDLSADSDGDGTPDYMDAGFDPATAGIQLDAGATNPQMQPDVGPKGVFWLDERYEDPDTGEYTAIGRCDLSAFSPASSIFWAEAPGSGNDSACVRATAGGAAWSRHGLWGDHSLPVTMSIGAATPKVVNYLADAGEFDVIGNAYALTGGHFWGDVPGDPDVFFFAPAVGQIVEVCSLGHDPWNWFEVQRDPAIGTAPEGWRVVWADSRNSVDLEHLTYNLYQALVPEVSLTASAVILRRGASISLTARVLPNYAGATVRFQKGKRKTDPVRFTYWTTLRSKPLGATSRATWTWTPDRRGTFYVHALFVGGTKYVTRAHYGANHVPNVSRWLRIVVK